MVKNVGDDIVTVGGHAPGPCQRKVAMVKNVGDDIVTVNRATGGRVNRPVAMIKNVGDDIVTLTRKRARNTRHWQWRNTRRFWRMMVG